MKVTVCELRNDEDGLERDWAALVSHVQTERSEFVLLPEMPFYPWLVGQPRADQSAWMEAVRAHDRWIKRLEELGMGITEDNDVVEAFSA